MVAVPPPSAPVADRTLACLAEDIERQVGVSVSRSQLSKVLRQKEVLSDRCPRHTLEGREEADAVAQVGLQLQLQLQLLMRKQQAEAGDIALPFGDESEAPTPPCLARADLAHARAPRGTDLRVPAPGQALTIAMPDVLDHVSRTPVATTARTKRSPDFVVLPERLDGLKPGHPFEPVVRALDHGPIHISELSRAALATREHRLTVERLPKYAPELTDIEGSRRDLKAQHLAHRTFTSLNDRDATIHAAG